MKKLTLGQKIHAGFGSILLILAIIGTFAYIKQQQSFADFTSYRELARDNDLASRLYADLLEARLKVKNYIQNPSAANATAYHVAEKDVQDVIGEAQQGIHKPERVVLVEDAVRLFDDYAKTFIKLENLDSQAGADELITHLDTVGPAIAKDAQAIKMSVKADQDELGPRVKAALEATLRTLLITCVVAIVIGVVMAVFITRSITRPVRILIETLTKSSEQTASASDQVSSSSQALAEGASEQAASLEETSASLEELSSMTQRNAESAAQAKDAAAQTRGSADAGTEQMQAMVTAMEAIKSASTEISNILKTIDEIAFQTNILALNAAVEAARAGEAGAGFAVVADEVRALAQRCAAAAKETATKIEDSVAKSQQGARISVEVANSFSTIQEQIRELDKLVADIATASGEQNEGLSQVTTAITQMDKVTQSTASSAEETAAAASELSAQSKTLTEAVDQLQVQIASGKHQSMEKNGMSVPQRPSNSHSVSPIEHVRVTETPNAFVAAAHSGPKPGAVVSPTAEVTSNQAADDFFKDS